MPPILTGDHPPSGNADINAPLQTIVKWQTLYVREVMGRRANFVEHCPQFFSVFEMGIVATKKLTTQLN
jgi:hypothetical protein